MSEANQQEAASHPRLKSLRSRIEKMCRDLGVASYTILFIPGKTPAENFVEKFMVANLPWSKLTGRWPELRLKVKDDEYPSKEEFFDAIVPTAAFIDVLGRNLGMDAMPLLDMATKLTEKTRGAMLHETTAVNEDPHDLEGNPVPPRAKPVNFDIPHMTCPHCGNDIDSATSVKDGEPPKSNDFAICGNCASVSMITMDQTLRKLTLQDRLDIGSHQYAQLMYSQTEIIARDKDIQQVRIEKGLE